MSLNSSPPGGAALGTHQNLPFPSGEFDPQALSAAKDAFNAQKRKLSQDDLQVLAQEVLFRLATSLEPRMPATAATGDEDIAAFCDTLLADFEGPSVEFITRARKEGVGLTEVYLGYIAGAARMLGERWDADQISFLDVTIATGHLYAIMRGLRPVFANEPFNPNRQAFFAAVPEETHTLGVSLAADMFRQRGWTVELSVGATHDAICEAFEQSGCPIAGISASRKEMVAALTRLILAFRIIRPNVFILLSGKITEEEPDIVKIADADCLANDPLTAIERLESGLLLLNSFPRHGDRIQFNG